MTTDTLAPVKSMSTPALVREFAGIKVAHAYKRSPAGGTARLSEVVQELRARQVLD